MHLLQWWLQRDQIHCRHYGSFAIMSDCDWCNHFYHSCLGAFTIVKGRDPVTHCGKGLVIALHGIHSLARHKRPIALVMRGSL